MKKNLLYLLGIPIVLLILSAVLTRNDSGSLLTSEYNPYLKELPLKYTDAIVHRDKSKTDFFSEVVENYGTRELIVIKPLPDDVESKVNFEIALYPSNNLKASKPIRLVIENDAAIYNYNDKTYGVFRKALPFIDIDKIVVNRKVVNKFHKKWRDTIENPFKPFKSEIISSNKNLQANPYKALFLEALKDNDISFLPSSYEVRKDALYKTKEDLNSFITKEGLTIAFIKNAAFFFESINKKTSIADLITFQGKQAKEATALIEEFDANKLALNTVFDVVQLASYLAIKEQYSNGCNESIYFAYNTDTKVLEPFFVDSNCLGKTLKFLTKPKLDDLEFVEAYLNKLDAISQTNIYQEQIASDTSFEEQLRLVNKYNPKEIFDLDNLRVNQRVIYHNIHEESAIKTELVSIDNKKMLFTVLNLSYYPVVVQGLNHEKKKNITSINPSRVILSGERDTVQIDLPRSFENLFVSKKSKATGFVLSKHIYSLFISYTIYGLDKTHYAPVLPYQAKEEIAEDLFRKTSEIKKRKDVFVNKKNKIVSIKEKNITISSPFIIPQGYTFIVPKGTSVDIVNGGKIISHGPVEFRGTKEEPIKIFSSDKNGQGILVFSEGKENTVSHTTFDFLSNLKHGYWNVTGAVNFYESPVKLNYVTVSNNRCEDALNIIRTNFVMNQCLITNTQSDAFDGDFVTGTVKNSKFINLGNDAIDVSGSDLIINNVEIIKADDKGLSAGEDSKMTVNNVTISTSAIAVAGKDLSIVNAKNLIIENTKLAFTAFQKKPEFGPSNITVTDVKMTNIETEHLVESTSSLIIDGKKVETSQNVKDRMYGAEFGVSSDDTRNKEYKN